MDYELLKKLKKWRETKAAQLNWPVYKILKNVTLESLATTKPSSEQDFLATPGIGPVNCKKYGRQLLEIVAKHENRESDFDEYFSVVPKSKENHNKTWEYADLMRLNELIEDGCSVKQIALYLGRFEFAIKKKLEFLEERDS